MLAVWAVAVGGLLCAVYDVFRVIRLRLGLRKGIPLFICDFAFCMFATLCMLVLFFNLTYGKVRLYAFWFVFLGFGLWRVTVGRLIVALLLWLLGVLSNFFDLAKQRIKVWISAVMRIIYTKNYCRRTLTQASGGFGLLKRKEAVNERNTKQTDAG